MEKPNDRLKKNGETNGTPRILAAAEIKIPDKEVHIIQETEKAPSTGTCSCNSVCTCVPVMTCTCDLVCTCDSVCVTNPYPSSHYGCSPHTCNCEPVCSCDEYTCGCVGYTCSCVGNICTCQSVCSCVRDCICNTVSYWYPN